MTSTDDDDDLIIPGDAKRGALHVDPPTDDDNENVTEHLDKLEDELHEKLTIDQSASTKDRPTSAE